MDNKGYYKILGITDEEQKLPGDKFQEICKKKYRNLSLKWHPDRWTSKSEKEQKEAEEKFKEISEAYSVLSDENKRRQYDNGGMEDFDFNGFDPFEMFRNMHMGGGFSDFGFNPFGGGGRRQYTPGSDSMATVKLSFEEAYNGCKKTVTYTRDTLCHKCNGTGSKDGKRHECPNCRGTGFITTSQHRGNMFFQSSSPCPNCHGTGTIGNGEKCDECGGLGMRKATETIEIDIPKGIQKNMQITIQGRGGESPDGGPNGNLYVVFDVNDDPYFEIVNGIHVVHYEKVPFNKALLGCEIECRTPGGGTVKVKVPELTEDGKAFYFSKKGMPNVNNPSIMGDYAVVIKHELPKKLTKEQREMLKNW